MIGKVKQINKSMEKGKPRIAIDSGEFTIGKGLIGDSYYGSKIEVILLPYDCREKINNSLENGLCFNRFIETISIDFNDYVLGIGEILKIGTAKFKVVSKGKRCFPECELLKPKKICCLAKETIYLDVIQNGEIKVNDKVYVCE